MTGRKRERKKSQYQFRLQLFLVCLESISSLHMKKLRLAAQAFWVLGLLVAHDNGGAMAGNFELAVGMRSRSTKGGEVEN